MTNPAIDIAAPVNIKAAVLGTRVIKNILMPFSCPFKSYTPVKSEVTAKAITMIRAMTKALVHIFFLYKAGVEKYSQPLFACILTMVLTPSSIEFI